MNGLFYLTMSPSLYTLFTNVNMDLSVVNAHYGSLHSLFYPLSLSNSVFSSSATQLRVHLDIVDPLCPLFPAVDKSIVNDLISLLVLLYRYKLVCIWSLFWESRFFPLWALPPPWWHLYLSFLMMTLQWISFRWLCYASILSITALLPVSTSLCCRSSLLYFTISLFYVLVQVSTCLPRAWQVVGPVRSKWDVWTSSTIQEFAVGDSLPALCFFAYWDPLYLRQAADGNDG